MAVDPAAATVIRRIFQEIAEGKRANLLARELNEEGIPTRLAYKQGKGEQCGRHYQADIWNHNKIHSISVDIRFGLHCAFLIYKI